MPSRQQSSASSGVGRLFHSLVVLGAALGASCGARVETTSTSTGGQDGGGGQGAATSSGGGSNSGGGPVTTTTTTSTGTGTMPIVDDPSDCEFSSQFSCNFQGECICDPMLPTGPDDCLSTTDFFCQQYDPEFVSCFCEPSAPDSPDECEYPDWFYCNVDSPPMGCHCLVPIA